MQRYQIRTGPTGLPGLVDAIASAVAAVDARISPIHAAQTARVVLGGRAWRTDECGQHAVCDAVGAAVFGSASGVGQEGTTGLLDPDARDLPRVYAAALVDSLGLGDERRGLEARVAAAFEGTIAAHLFEHRSCGASSRCQGPPRDPTRR